MAYSFMGATVVNRSNLECGWVNRTAASARVAYKSSLSQAAR